MKIKITSLVMISALIFMVIVGVSIGVFNQMQGNELYEDQAYKQLLSIAESKVERVENFLDNRKADAVFLSEFEEVRSLFDEDLVHDVNLMAEKIKSISEKAREEIEVYLSEHPDMTLKDLQNNEVFQSIAVQRVGDTGYTFVEDDDLLIMFFHKDPAMVGFDTNTIKETLPAAWEIASLAKGGHEASGFYDWVESNGVVREKYTHIFPIGRKTADGVGLFVGATTYVDEYGGSVQLVSDLNSELKNFQRIKDYSDLILINSNGDVIWTAKQHNELGTNLVAGVYNESLLANVFNNAKKDLSVGVSNFEVYGAGGELSIFVTSPVIEVDDVTGKRDLLGVVALQLNGERISELIEADIGLGEAGEVYIINRARRHVSSLKFHNHSYEYTYEDGEGHIFISSEGIENCFKDYDNYYFSLQGEDIDKISKTEKYFDYAEEPNLVLGAHQYVLESGWCVIAEMDYNYFLEGIPRDKGLFINFFVIFILLFVTCLVLDVLFKIRRKKK